MSKHVAVVTGSNKGIGYAVVRGLCKQFDGDVYVTARNEELGLKAVDDLKKEGYDVKFHQLDITKHDTIEKLKTFLQDNYGGLDILVNNAGVSYTKASTAPFSEQAEVTMLTNFSGTLDVCDVLFPILRSNARCIILACLAQYTYDRCGCITYLPMQYSYDVTSEWRNNDVTSRVRLNLMLKREKWRRDEIKTFHDILTVVVNISGKMALLALKQCREDLQKTLVDRDRITIADIKNLMHQFVDSTKTGTYGDLGWPEMSYGVSKIGVAVMSIIQQREFLMDARPDIIVNTCCPGLVITDMSSHKGTKTIYEGADTPLYLALLPSNTTSPKGEFVSDRTIVNFGISAQKD